MASVAASQLTLDFQPSLPERFKTLREYIAHRAMVVDKPLKVQAADMDLSPSTLSRKLNPSDSDTQRFNVDDLEDWLDSTKDAPAVLAYLVAKYMDSDEARRSRVLNRVESIIPELIAMVASLKEQAC
jgi:hypothetical protein